MKKILSIILSAAMLATSSSGAFAAQSEPQGDYNSLKLNVVNEAQNETTPAAEELEMFSIDAPAVMANDDTSTASSGEDCKVYDARFDVYYKAEDYEQRIRVDWNSAIAQKIMEENIENAERADFAFYNQSEELVNVMNDVEIDYFYNWYSYGYLEAYMNFVGFEPGDYDAEIILYNESGVSYNLGKAKLGITDKTILNYAQIINSVNGWGELAQTTEYFYVRAMIDEIFVNLDKIEMYLLNANGEEVAKTVSKDIAGIYNNRGGNETELMYRLKVTQPLISDGDYTLDIRTAPELEMVNYSGEVYVYVSGYPMASASMDKNFKVSLYTENVIPGEYVAAYWNDNGEQDLYNVTIDNQGKGSFNFIPPTEPQYYYKLELLTKEDNSYVCKFEIYNSNNGDYFYDGYTRPSFLSPAVSTVNNFEARIQSELKELTTESIKSVEITQDDEVVATLNNYQITDSWEASYKGASNYVEGTEGWLKGNLTVLAGKSLDAGTEVVMVVTFTDGSACRMWIPVADATTSVRGELEVDNYAYYWENIDSIYVNYAVGNVKPSFTIDGTNITSGDVVLYRENDDEEIERISISALSKTTEYGYVHTYKGTFTTELQANEIYTICVEANDDSLYFGSFIYYGGKMASNYSNLTVSGRYGYVYLEEFLNISNLNNVSFKVVSGKNKQAYDVPAEMDYLGDNYADYSLDFSNVPTGYFTLKAYDGNTEIKLLEFTNGYNYGYTDKILTTGTGTVRVNGERYQAVFGTNLDKVQKAEIKLYKEVTGEVKGQKFEKLEYVKDAELAKPYNNYYITISPELLSGMETGDYTVIYILDGEAVEADTIYTGRNTDTDTDIDTDTTTPSISVETVKGRGGDTVEVDVAIADNSGITSLGIELDYDESIMTLTDVKINEDIGVIVTTAKDFGVNPYNISFDSTHNFTHNGRLVTLVFDIKDEAPTGEYPITVDYYKGPNGDYQDGGDINYDENYEPVSIEYKSGALKIYTPGDLNDDKRINNKDVTYILRYLADWDIPDIVTVALDTDGSGSVDEHDATNLLRYIAKWAVELY